MTERSLRDEILLAASIQAELEDTKDYLLDYSERSLIGLDDMIDDFWDESGPRPENREQTVFVIGSYVGAVIDRHYNGHWVKEQSGLINFETETSGVGMNPFTWVHKRFDLHEGLAPKYKAVMKLAATDRKFGTLDLDVEQYE